MTTGHVNPGYENLVSGMTAAMSNPSGSPSKPQFNSSELQEIRNRARSVWSGKDTSETTYGYFHTDPKKISQVRTRPTSPTRLNNPHPKKLVPAGFLSARLDMEFNLVLCFLSVFSWSVV